MGKGNQLTLWSVIWLSKRCPVWTNLTLCVNSSLVFYPHRKAKRGNLWLIMFKLIRKNRAQSQQNHQIAIYFRL